MILGDDVELKKTDDFCQMDINEPKIDDFWQNDIDRKDLSMSSSSHNHATTKINDKPTNSQDLDTIQIHRLENTANTCWLNSLVQILFAIFKEDNSFLPCDETILANRIYNWIHGMAQASSMMINLHNLDVLELPFTFKKSFLICIDKYVEWGMGSQQDATEALQSFINQCNSLEVLKHVQFETYSCPACGSLRESVLTESFISLPICASFMVDNKFDVENSLRDNFNKYHDSAAICENEHCKFQLKRKVQLVNNTRYLLVELIRAQANGAKNNVSCKLGEIMDVKIDDNDIQFKLLASMKHIGKTTNRGHYISYRKLADTWFECNDASIRPSDLKELEYSNFFIYKNQINQ